MSAFGLTNKLRLDQGVAERLVDPGLRSKRASRRMRVRGSKPMRFGRLFCWESRAHRADDRRQGNEPGRQRYSATSRVH